MALLFLCKELRGWSIDTKKLYLSSSSSWRSLPADVLWGSFVTHSFLLRGPQRTSAGRLHHDGHPRCFKPMYLNFQQLLLFHKMFEIGEIRCIECKEFCLTLSYPRASRLQRAHCSPFLKLNFAFEHLLFKLKYCLWRLLTKRKWGN